MEKVIRQDNGSCRVIRSANGWLKAEATLTRTGVFVYRNTDGTLRRELRLPEEVFHPDSLATLELVPVTIDHPDCELLDSTNATKYSVGSVGTDIRVDGDKVKGTLALTDEKAVAAVDVQAKRGVSCGYQAMLDATPGVWNGQPYDGIQRQIRYNHVALTRNPRAGQEACIHLDSAIQVEVKETGENMKTVRLDGVDYEVPEQVAQAIEKSKSLEKSNLEQAQARLDQAVGEKDALKARLDQAEAALAELSDPKRIQEAVACRLEIERAAAVILPDARFDSDSDQEVFKKVILKAQPNAELEGKSEDYIRARFDACIESARLQSTADVRSAAKNAGGDVNPVQSARERMLERSRNAWKGDRS